MDLAEAVAWCSENDMTLAVYDIDLASRDGVWTPAFTGRTAPARALLRGFNKQLETVLGAFGATMLRGAAGALHTLLGSEFGDEVNELAELIGVSPREVVLANVAYDISHAAGCSTFVADTEAGPLHARNLDWDFPGELLRRHTSVVRVRNAPAGDYACVTWPGLFGALTGVAPGRFAITVNYVNHAEESSVAGVARRALKGYWPVTWVVRQALDHAKSFDAAVKHLRSAKIIAPVLFTVSGTRSGEGVVIERSAETSAARKLDDGSVCVTNHYVSRTRRHSNTDLGVLDTEARLEHLHQHAGNVDDSSGALRLLASKTLLAENTQHQVVMRAADGLLVVKVPGGRARRVTMSG
ncbi:MAG: C45 family peptidase [Deltaproteobacteria bacterium]